MIRRVGLVAAFVALAACGGDGPPFDTGLPEDEPANELGPAEAIAACEAYEDAVSDTFGPDDQEDVACTIAGVVVELGGFGTCETTRDQCLASGEEEPVPVDFDCENALSFAPSGCEATVGELEACVNAFLGGVEALRARVSCGLANDPNALADVTAEAGAAFEPTSHAACSALSDECLALLGWADDVDPLGP